MFYTASTYRYIKDLYLRLFMQDMPKFVFLWVALAFVPLLASLIFEEVFKIFFGLQVYYLEVFLFLCLPLFISIFAAFIFISLWVAFKSQAPIYTKLTLIMLTYILIWLSFGNLYYFIAGFDNLVQIQTAYALYPNTSNLAGIIKDIPPDSLSTLKPFWDFSLTDSKINIQTVNRWDNYFDCLYFSGVNILTIGFGDIVPVNKLFKLLTLMEGFLGTAINVIAVGMWFSMPTNNSKEE